MDITHDDEMRPEYAFDYSKAKPNRFASQPVAQNLSVAHDPDMFVPGNGKVTGKVVVVAPKSLNLHTDVDDRGTVRDTDVSDVMNYPMHLGG